jgi:hypothetical protein
MQTIRLSHADPTCSMQTKGVIVEHALVDPFPSQPDVAWTDTSIWNLDAIFLSIIESPGKGSSIRSKLV